MNKAAEVAVTVLAGASIAVQSRINGELGRRLDDGVAAATVSFGTGLILLLCLLPWLGRDVGALPRALRDGSLRWWQCLGGACGAFLVATQGLAVTEIGVALFTVAVVAGQSASSLAVDRSTWMPGGRRPITITRAFGAVLCVIAVAVAASGRLGEPQTLALAVLPALAGVGIAWQQGVNGLVRQATGAVFPATLLNFLVGTTALLAVLAVELAVRGMPRTFPPEPWLYLGGALGMFSIAISAAIVAQIGVLLMSMSMIMGQLAGALVIDSVLPAASGRPTAPTFIGAALALVAVLIAARPARATPDREAVSAGRR